MFPKHSDRKNEDAPPAAAGTAAAPETDSVGASPDFDSLLPDMEKLKRGRRRRTIITVVVLLLIAAALFGVVRRVRQNRPQAAGAYTEYTVSKRDLEVTLSGSGNLKPANSYVVTTLLEGEILSSPFEEGDTVGKDTLLYQIDTADASASIEQAQNALAQSQRNYDNALKSREDLNVKAKAAGTLTELTVEVGDTVSPGAPIGKIRNSAVMRLTVPFDAADAASMTVGQSAVVTLDGSFEILMGTVTDIAAADEVLAGNRIVRSVTIDVKNPGGLSARQTATAVVGGAACAGSGSFAYKDEVAVTAAVGGEIREILAAKGDGVTKNQVLLTLRSDAVESSIFNAEIALKNARLALQSQSKRLDDYAIKSPIAGTIVEKNYKQGDMLKAGSSLCTIFDLTYLTLTLNIDELDIGKVQVGQEAALTADAVPGKTYKGVVTRINTNGTTSNGVTSYPVTIRIDEMEGLLPGMNVSAQIIVSSLKDVLTVPVSAVTRNNLVLVKSADAAAEDAVAEPGLPAGFVRREVTLGGSDRDFVAVTEGLKEGDIVAVLNSEADAVITVAGGPAARGGRMG